MRYLDEDDVRVRPSKGSRPRTRRRPAHNEARDGFVTTVDRGRYTCRVGKLSVTATLARELGKRGVVVGDRVKLIGDVSGKSGALARIIRVEKRSSTLRRSADDGDSHERVIVANISQMVIVVALADPEPKTGLIDRCLVAAEDAGIKPLLCLTKSDLATPEKVLSHYDAIDLPYVVWQQTASIEPLMRRLTDELSVLVGHSGVGKSTIVNALLGKVTRRVGEVTSIGKGRHTSTSARAFELPEGGWIIDTPGIRSFGLVHIPHEDLLHGFPDLLPGSLNCQQGCDHSHPQEGCALDAWVAEGHAPASRLISFRGLLASLTS